MGIPRIIRKIVPKSIMYIYDRYMQHRNMHSQLTEEEWIQAGKPVPAPPVVKRAMMLKYKELYQATRFIETGTFMGDTTAFMIGKFEYIDSCELDEKLADRAKNIFKSYNNVTIWQGDSGQRIKDILNTIPKESICFFWLDGHYSGGITAKTDVNTPILAEIESIYNHNNHHVIFIDDARMFQNNIQDYPSVEALKIFILNLCSYAKIEIEDDIIRITPN
jgi:hypothetical protein